MASKRLTMTGILIFDHLARYEQAREQIREWLRSGQIRSLTDERKGLEQAPQALVDLLAGGNTGTRIVRVSD